MQINWVAIGGSLLGAWYFIRKWLKWIYVFIEPAVKEAEERARDGLIDKADRKAIAESLIKAAESEGKIKLSWIARIFLSKMIDGIARKLPDFHLSEEGVKHLKEKEGGK